MLNPSLDEQKLISFEAGLEPVNVKPRFENPKADIDRDKSRTGSVECCLFCWQISGLSVWVSRL